MVDKLGDFNFDISGVVNARVRCQETDGCGVVVREWTLNGSVPINNYRVRVPYTEPALPIPFMKYAIWADKVLRASQFVDEWKGALVIAARALMNSPTLICNGYAFLK